MASLLREPVGPEQQALLKVIGEPFIGMGKWPVWQYVDLTLQDEHGLDAESVLASLPEAGDKSPTSLGYGLTWRMDSYRQPNPADRVALTIAGLRFLPQAETVTRAFAAVVGHLASQQAQLVPSPEEVVAATVTSDQLAERLRESGYQAEDGGRDADLLARIRALLEHEPFLFGAAHQPGPSEPWTVKVPAVLRRYRDVTSVEEYIDTVTALVAPPDPPSVPPAAGALDIPYAIGYLDAVWQARTGKHLFAYLDPASVARVTLVCSSEEEFNSLMSALADVLGQVVVPGTVVPPQRGALEAVREFLATALATEAADRVEHRVRDLDPAAPHPRQHAARRRPAPGSHIVRRDWPGVPAAQLGAGVGAHRHARRRRAGRYTGRSARRPLTARRRRGQPVEITPPTGPSYAIRAPDVRRCLPWL